MMIVSSVTPARQVVELSGVEAMRPGPVSQRGLSQQGFERPPGIVEYLLPRQSRGRSCPDLAAAIMTLFAGLAEVRNPHSAHAFRSASPLRSNR